MGPIRARILFKAHIVRNMSSAVRLISKGGVKQRSCKLRVPPASLFMYKDRVFQHMAMGGAHSIKYQIKGIFSLLRQ